MDDSLNPPNFFISTTHCDMHLHLWWNGVSKIQDAGDRGKASQFVPNF